MAGSFSPSGRPSTAKASDNFMAQFHDVAFLVCDVHMSTCSAIQSCCGAEKLYHAGRDPNKNVLRMRTCYICTSLLQNPVNLMETYCFSRNARSQRIQETKPVKQPSSIQGPCFFLNFSIKLLISYVVLNSRYPARLPGIAWYSKS